MEGFIDATLDFKITEHINKSLRNREGTDNQGDVNGLENMKQKQFWSYNQDYHTIFINAI